jgi:hypothetical protein
MKIRQHNWGVILNTTNKIQNYFTNYHTYMFRHYRVILREFMWIVLNINCITNSSIWNTCVTWQGIDYKLPEDDTIVSKRFLAVW